MEILKNQTLYQCSFCSKRLLTKAGAILHENDYCKNENSPHVENCKHEHVETAWVLISGEDNAHEPDYDFCVECGTHFD
jgi:hypothetical protein